MYKIQIMHDARAQQFPCFSRLFDNLFNALHPNIGWLKLVTFLPCAVDSSELDTVVGALFEVRVCAGEVVIKQGEDGDNFYIVDEGECEVYVSQGGQQRLVSSLRQGNYFGELALMYNCPRAASVHARTDGTLFALAQDVFHHILRSSAQDRRAQYDTVSLFLL
jgi:cAMP-dependent protein kinase regulator